jgi:hypothetical protein
MGGTNLLHKISLAQGQASAERSLATVSATRGIYKLLSDKGPRDERSIPTFPIVHKFGGEPVLALRIGHSYARAHVRWVLTCRWLAPHTAQPVHIISSAIHMTAYTARLLLC